MADDAQVYHYSHNMPTKPPNSVVSLVPSMTETLFDLGLGKYVVGVTDDCLFPAASLANKRRFGPMHAVQVDEVIQRRPDTVIVNLEENSAADIAALEQSGINVWKTFPRTVLDAMNLIWDTLHLFMVDDRMLYERVNLIHRTIDWVGGVSEAHEDEICKVFVPLLNYPMTTFGPDTYAHDLLRVAGGTNVFANRKPDPTTPPAEDILRYPVVTLDDVQAAQPDIVLLPTYPLGYDDGDVATFSKLDMPASHNQQIYVIDGTLLMYHGTRLARALNEISALMCAAEGADEF